MNIEELMNIYYSNLNENDKLICKYIINNKNKEEVKNEKCYEEST